MKKLKIMQGICLLMLLIIIGLIVIFYFNLTSDGNINPDEGMDETGLGIVLLFFLGGFFLLYTFLYCLFYIRLWKRKYNNHFHEVNKKITGFILIIIILSILIIRRAIVLIFLGPLIVPFVLLYISSSMYIKITQK